MIISFSKIPLQYKWENNWNKCDDNDAPPGFIVFQVDKIITQNQEVAHKTYQDVTFTIEISPCQTHLHKDKIDDPDYPI